MNSNEEYQKTKADTDLLMQIISEHTGLKFEEAPKYAQIDYIGHGENEKKFFVEVKMRRHKQGTYSLGKIPASKWAWAYAWYHEFGINSYLIILWQDSLGMVDLLRYSKIDRMVARYDRGAGQDIYAFYDLRDFSYYPDIFEDCRYRIDFIRE